MKALVYHGKGDLRIENLERPAIKADEVLIRVKYCGVCGTDIHIYHGEGGSHDVSPPRILGHEFSGFVESTGAEVKSVRIGDLVSVDPNVMCGKCYHCRRGQAHFCTDSFAYGVTKDGGFAEYAVARASAICRYRGDIDPLAAAMTEPLSCCIHGIDLCGVKAGDEVLVTGGGPIGLTMLQLAKLSGAGKVILIEPVAAKRKLAEKLGADITVDPFGADVSGVLKTHSRNIDVVIECAGNTEMIERALSWAGMGATIMMFGLTGPDAEIKIRPDQVFKKELKITSSFINPCTFGRAATLIESGKTDLISPIANILDLEDSVQAFENPEIRRLGKVVVRIS
jgi:2-desacetyl-2-hydroxyethyl bacteriochlorophyllide A dehydrogenase